MMNNTLTIDYAPEDDLHMACSDWQAEAVLLEEWKRCQDGFDVVIGTSTENVLYAAFALVAEGKIDCAGVRVIFRGHTIRLTPWGELQERPENLCGFTTDMIWRRMYAAGLSAGVDFLKDKP